MFLVGLTGGIASGKSMVVSILPELGRAIINADLIARQVVRLGTPAFWGWGAAAERGAGQRKVGCRYIFWSGEEMHAKLHQSPTNLQMLRQTLFPRLMRRNSFSSEEAMKRFAAQLPLDSKLPLANHIIDNSGDKESTRRQVLQLHAWLESSLAYLAVRITAVSMATELVVLACGLLRRLWQ